MPVGYDTVSGSVIDGLASDLLSTRDADPTLNPYGKDADWLKSAFIVTEELQDPIDKANRSFTSAELKYTDSSIGGNHAINPPPQFCRYSDIRSVGFRMNAKPTQISYTGGSTGMGRYYSEAIDDNNQIVHFRFGTTSFNSLTTFFTGFYHTSAGNMARAARADDNWLNAAFQTVGTAAGVLIGIAVAPLFIIPFAFSLIGTAVRFFARWPATKYAYLKPAMPQYWTAVSSMVNQICVNTRLVSYAYGRQTEALMGKETYIDEEQLSIFSQIVPEFSKKGIIDVYALATKASRLQARHEYHKARMFEKLMADDQRGIAKREEDDSWYEAVKKIVYGDEDSGKGGIARAHPAAPIDTSIEALWQRWLDVDILAWMRGKDDSIENALKQANKEGETQDGQITYSPNSYKEEFFNYFVQELADGGQFVSFRVDYTGASNESFNNTSTQSALQQKVNSMSSSARNLKYSFAGGNIDPLGISQSVVDGAVSLVQGAANTLQIGGLLGLAGNAFADIPEHWESSTANLPKASYSFTLISPYGNLVSQMFNIYIPMCCILAGALPLSTGPQSWTAPFMCEFYDRGRCITKYGMIDSLSFTRGSSNLGFTREGRALAVEVTFTVKDLTSIMHMPIQPGFNPFKPLEHLFDGDNAFEDYMAAISGMELKSRWDRWPLLMHRMTKKFTDIQSYASPARLAQRVADFPGIGMLGAFLRGTDRK